MTKKITASSKILTVIAFILLWITQGMFYYLEIASSNNFLSYILLGVLCLTVFSLTLNGAKYTPVLVVGLVGVVTLCIVYSFVYGTERLILLAPVVCFAPLLFLINDFKEKTDNVNDPFFKKIGYELFGILPFIVLGLIIYAIIKQSYYFEKGQIYYMFISIAVASLYFFSAKNSNGNVSGKRKTKLLSSPFMIAGILIIESGLYCIVNHLLIISSTVAMLWFVVYLFLYEHKNPVCVNAIKIIHNYFKKFIDI